MIRNIVELSDEGRQLRLLTADGESLRFHAFWLRDNALEDDTRSSANGQRLITMADIPEGTRIRHAEITDNAELAVEFSPEKKTSVFPISWLKAHAYDRPATDEEGWLDPTLILWDRSLGNAVPFVDFNTACEDENSRHDWLRAIRSYGVAKMTGCPLESGALIKVADLFGYVRETNYGKWFDVRSEVNPSNLAYTSLGLQAHTDNPYRDPVPTMQILYCLENTAEGGESMVVDGFSILKKLQAENPDSFSYLKNYSMNFEYRGDEGQILKTRKPMIDISADGELVGIRFNNRAAAPITRVPFEKMEAFYEAYRHLESLIDDPEMQVTFKLEAGECFIVDNTRVLHSRTAFSGEGTRWLQGCYPDKDALLAKLEYLDRNEAD